jgi:hypothetical protein
VPVEEPSTASSLEVAARIASNSAPRAVGTLINIKLAFSSWVYSFVLFSPTPRLDMAQYVVALSHHASIGRVIS